MQRDGIIVIHRYNNLLNEIIKDVKGDDAQLKALLLAFDRGVPVPFTASVIGERVQVMQFQYGGNVRRGLTATCERKDGTAHVVSACDIEVAPQSHAAPYLAAYREWMGLAQGRGSALPSVELVVLSIKQITATCRPPGSLQHILFRTSRKRELLVPGEIIVVVTTKRWTGGGNTYITGKIDSSRLDVCALGLVPLRLRECGIWNPKEHFWGEHVGKWAKPIKARGPRPQYEMEQILPGVKPGDYHSDPIIDANDLAASGDFTSARQVLMDLCQKDLRCLDAHSHLGLLMFHSRPKDAIRHYEAGFRIGELSLSKNFDGLLPWGCIGNRPFLRCMNGFGLCLWRLRRFEEASRIFDRMLWLNPDDNQGVRFFIDDVKAKKEWKNDD